MSAEVREGVVDRLTPNGVVLGGTRMGYSKWFEGERLTEAALGHTVQVLVDARDHWTFIKKVLFVGGKVPGWPPPRESPSAGPSGGGPWRRISSEELTLKREEGVRIARSVSIDRAITITEKGIPIDRIVPLAHLLEEYLLSGRLPGPEAAARPPEVPPGSPLTPESDPVPVSPPSAPPPPEEAAPAEPAPVPPKAARPKKPTSQQVNGLFNEARRAKLVADWKAYEALIRRVLGVEVKSAYHLAPEEFSRVEAFVRSRIGPSKVA